MSEPIFWSAVWLTIKYSVVTVAAEFAIGLGIALMLTAP